MKQALGLDLANGEVRFSPTKLCPCYFCAQGTCPICPTLVTPLEARGLSETCQRPLEA